VSALAAAATFRYCPACAAPIEPTDVTRYFRCTACDYTLFFNAGGAASAIVRDGDGRIALLRRAREPKKGMLTLPGGFVEPGESGEESLRREVEEETGLLLGPLTFLTALPNAYPYRDVLYLTLDLVYVADAVGGVEAAEPDEVTEILWLRPDEVPLEEMAFASLRESVRQFRGSGGGG
jgi:NAD+ diphosphatase